MPPLGEISPHVGQLGVNLAVCSTEERVPGKSQGFQWQRCACTFLACSRGDRWRDLNLPFSAQAKRCGWCW